MTVKQVSLLSPSGGCTKATMASVNLEGHGDLASRVIRGGIGVVAWPIEVTSLSTRSP